MPGSRYARAAMIAVAVVVVLGLVASMVAVPIGS
jgi:hypothetical protein